MENIRSIHLRLLQGRLGDIAYQLTRVQFSSFQRQEAWCPPVNVYRFRDRMVICVDLAGVDKSQIDVHVEPRRVYLSGRRQPPEPEPIETPPLQILAWEIDHGPFEREIPMPLEVEPKRVRAEQREGLLWIYLPLASNA